jgi:hypothetical protein
MRSTSSRVGRSPCDRRAWSWLSFAAIARAFSGVSPFAEYAVMPVAGNAGHRTGAAIPAAAAPAD